MLFGLTHRGAAIHHPPSRFNPTVVL